jgi:adenosylmethionine-8-amino-7-oxononanoate aminotransferase
LFPVVRAHAPYCYRCPVGLDRSHCAIECLGDLEARLSDLGDTVAGVIVEPMLQGAGGMITWPAEFLGGVQRTCTHHRTLLIADEVLTGFGRTGRMFACEHASIAPDILCLSKALTAGYLPLAATLATDEIYDAFLSTDRTRTFFHGHSFTANPLACAVALASLRLFEEHDLLGRIRRLERQLHAGFTALSDHPLVGDTRVLGAVGALELVTDKATRAAGGYLDTLGPQLAAAFLERGLLLRPLGNVLYFMPPYVIDDAQVEWALAQIADVLESVYVH